MFRPLILMTASLFCATLVNAQNGPQLEIQLPDSTLNLGTLKLNTIAKSKIVFKNVGKVPLVITNIQTSCGCAIVDYPKMPIMPDKIGTLNVHFNASIPGPVNKAITIYSNINSGGGRTIARLKGVVVH